MKQLFYLTLRCIIILQFGFIKLSAQSITFYKKDHWKGPEILPTHAAITVDLTSNIVTINGESNYFNNWRSYPVNSINIPGFGKLIWHIPKRDAIIQRLYGGSEYFWIYTEDDVKVKNTKFFKDIRAERKKASDAHWAAQKEEKEAKKETLKKIKSLIEANNPDAAAFVFREKFTERYVTRDIAVINREIHLALIKKYKNTKNVYLTKKQKNVLFKEFMEQYSQNIYPSYGKSLTSTTDSIKISVKDDSFYVHQIIWDPNSKSYKDFVGHIKLKCFSSAYDYKIRQVGVTSFKLKSETLISKTPIDSVKIQINKRTYKKIKKSKWMLHVDDSKIKPSRAGYVYIDKFNSLYFGKGWQTRPYSEVRSYYFKENQYVQNDSLASKNQFFLSGVQNNTVRELIESPENPEDKIILNQMRNAPIHWNTPLEVLNLNYNLRDFGNDVLGWSITIGTIYLVYLVYAPLL